MLTRCAWAAILAFGLGAGALTPSRAEEPVDRNHASAPNPARGAAPIKVGKSRYGWTWLAERFDQNQDGAVSREELAASAEIFARLDRTWDGSLTAADFDWSAAGELDRQKEVAFPLFRNADTESDGRISPEEWQALFAKAAGDKGYLSDEDFERLIFQPRLVRGQKQREAQAKRGSRQAEKGGAGGPSPGEMAPDFELRSPDGATQVKLSAFRGKKPVVLIFGSFT